MGVRRLLSIGSIGADDTSLWGLTPLQAVGKRLRIAVNRQNFDFWNIDAFAHRGVETQICDLLNDCLDDQPTIRNRYLEILNLLIESGAAGRAHYRITAGPKTYVRLSSLNTLSGSHWLNSVGTVYYSN